MKDLRKEVFFVALLRYFVIYKQNVAFILNRFLMKYTKRKTFTLIEMLIVIVIIGILAAALIPRLQSIQ